MIRGDQGGQRSNNQFSECGSSFPDKRGVESLPIALGSILPHSFLLQYKLPGKTQTLRHRIDYRTSILERRAMIPTDIPCALASLGNLHVSFQYCRRT